MTPPAGQAATQYFAKLGITIERVITDNGSAFRSHAFRISCHTLGIRQKFTPAYRPQTNGRAERFIQYACGNGPTDTRTSTQISGVLHCRSGTISSTGIAPTMGSAAKPPALGY